MTIPADFYLGTVQQEQPPLHLAPSRLTDAVEADDGVVVVGEGQRPQMVQGETLPYPSLFLLKLNRDGIVWSRAYALCPDGIDCFLWRIKPVAITRIGNGFAVAGTAKIEVGGGFECFVAFFSDTGDLLRVKIYRATRSPDLLTLTGIVDATPASGAPSRLLVLGAAPILQPSGPALPRAFSFVIDGEGPRPTYGE